MTGVRMSNRAKSATCVIRFWKAPASIRIQLGWLCIADFDVRNMICKMKVPAEWARLSYQLPPNNGSKEIGDPRSPEAARRSAAITITAK